MFYRCENRQISDLTEFLDSEHRDHLYAVTVEMYGSGPAASLAIVPDGPAPIELLDHFDPFGFVTLDPGRFHNVIVRGGLQRRVLFKTRPRQSPALKPNSFGQVAVELFLCRRYASHPADAPQSAPCPMALEPNRLHPAVRAF